MNNTSIIKKIQLYDNYFITIIAIINAVSVFNFISITIYIAYLSYCVYYTGAPIENASKPEIICARYDIINEGNKFVLMN